MRKQKFYINCQSYTNEMAATTLILLTINDTYSVFHFIQETPSVKKQIEENIGLLS